MKQETCEKCGGTKNGWNIEKEESVCDNRSCPESPMNNYLVVGDEIIGK